MASMFLKNSDYCYFRWETDSKWTHEIFRRGNLLKNHFNVFFWDGSRECPPGIFSACLFLRRGELVDVKHECVFTTFFFDDVSNALCFHYS